MTPRALVAGTIALAMLLAQTQARAGNEAAAEALFMEAKRLAAAGKHAEACPKFAESNRLDRGAGTMIHLADCYEKTKQTASAWATYREAASAAQALNRADWQKLANARANALEPKLARLTLKVEDPAPKIEVKRDDAPVSQASWGVPIPVDIGAHTVEATAPGHKPFRGTVTIAKDGEKTELVVPKLVGEPAVAATPPPAGAVAGAAQPLGPKPADADASSGSAQKTIGFVVLGLGVASVGVGAITGLMAMGAASDAKKDCPNDGACASRDAVDAADSASGLGTVSTITFAAGGAALVGGLVLVLTSPSRSPSAALRVVPSASASTRGLSFSGAF
jgi:hypothetical protein